MRIFTILISFLSLSACSMVPKQVATDNQNLVSYQQVLQTPDAQIGKTARWGGVITQVINNEQSTQMEILALELNNSAKPIGSRQNSPGRFIAEFPQFLDPEIYQADQLITMIGVVEQPVKGKIGEYNYQFPKIMVQGAYLWPERKEPRQTVVHGFWWPHYWYWHRHSFGYGPYRSHYGWYQPYWSLYWSNFYHRPYYNGYRYREPEPSRPHATINRPIKIDQTLRQKQPRINKPTVPRVRTHRPARAAKPVIKRAPRTRKIDGPDH